MVSTLAVLCTQWHTMVEYEYRVLSSPERSGAATSGAQLTEHAEYGRWELDALRLYLGGARRVWLRRRIIRVQRTA